MIVIGKELIQKFKNGVRIMSIDARYLYSACKEKDDENGKVEQNKVGYDTSVYWEENTKKSRVPEKLYAVKVPYSLCLEKMNEVNPNEFVEDDYKNAYTNMIINVTFKGAAKVPKVGKPKSDGTLRKITPKFIIRNAGEGRNKFWTIKKVARLEVEKNRENLRKELYENGFVLDGNKYVNFMRSTSKSRGGNMLFIKEEYKSRILIEWARLGLEFSEDEVIDVAGLKSYESLVLSGICGKLQISPKEILLIKDYDSIFTKKASVTELNDKERLIVSDKDNEYKNSIWDGMSLMDSSKYSEFIEFPDVSEHSSLTGKSFVLLRNLWFKSAAFNCNVQQYFADNGVTIADVKKHGWTAAEKIEDIKLITTPNSLKFLKMKKFVNDGKSDNLEERAFKRWLSYIEDNSYFGVVKSEHGMKDHARRCNSQFLMALPLSKDEVRKLLECGEFPYIEAMRNDNETFLIHLANNKNNSNSMILELASFVPDIMKTDLYKTFRNNTLNDYIETWKKKGIKIPNSDFCVCVSNPMEMLQYASGVEAEQWNRIHNGRESYCKYYANEEKLFAARNPCVSSGNIICLENKSHEWLDKYMVLSDNIVVVNSIESDIMERASGMDYDSDQMWLSSNEILVEKAQFCEENFLTPVNKVKQQGKREKKYKVEDFAETDYQISKGKVGDIVNMGQILQAYYWHIYFDYVPLNDEEEQRKKAALKRLYDKISILSSASNVEIDRAKREFAMDTDKELNDLRKLGMLDNEDGFLKDFIQYDKPKNVRKNTITQADLNKNTVVINAFNAIEELQEVDNRNEKEQKKLKESYKVINDFIKNHHKKDASRIQEKMMKPLYFQFMFPENSESSVYFEQGMNCPMDNLCVLASKAPTQKKRPRDKMNIIQLMNSYTDISPNDKHRKKIEEIAQKYNKFCKQKKANYKKNDAVKPLSNKDYFEECVNEIKDIKLTHATIVNIFNACYGSEQAKSHSEELAKIRKHAIDLIYAAHRDKVLECFKGRVLFGQRYFKKIYLVPVEKESA